MIEKHLSGKELIKAMRRSLIASAVALSIFVCMFVGTTYAWMTDKISSGANRIMAGSLDVELNVYHGGSYTELGNDALFPGSMGSMWEPGQAKAAFLEIKNAGTLALDYQLQMTITKENAGVNVKGETFRLSDHLIFKQIDCGTEDPSSLAAYKENGLRELALSENARPGFAPYELKTADQAGTELAGGASRFVAFVVYMPTEGDWEGLDVDAFNHDGVTVPSLQLNLSLLARQAASESDAFGADYDRLSDQQYLVNGQVVTLTHQVKEGVYTNGTAHQYYITKAAGFGKLAGLDLTASDTVFLAQDIALPADFTASDFAKATLDGGGHCISGPAGGFTNAICGLFNKLTDCTVKNLTLRDITLDLLSEELTAASAGILAAKAAGSVTVENLRVEHSAVCLPLATPAKNTAPAFTAGGVLGSYTADDAADKLTVKNTVVTGITLSGTEYCAGLVGLVTAQTAPVLTGNAVTAITYTSDPAFAAYKATPDATETEDRYVKLAGTKNETCVNGTYLRLPAEEGQILRPACADGYNTYLTAEDSPFEPGGETLQTNGYTAPAVSE